MGVVKPIHFGGSAGGCGAAAAEVI